MRGLEIKCWESTVQQRERFRKSSRTKLGVKLVLHTVSSATSRVVVLSLSRTPLLAFFFSFSSIHILGYFLISKCQESDVNAKLVLTWTLYEISLSCLCPFGINVKISLFISGLSLFQTSKSQKKNEWTV